MKPQKPFAPTRICPHRLCRPLHATGLVLGGAVLSQTLFEDGLVALLFFALMTVIAGGIAHLIHRKSMLQLAMDDAVREASGVQLVVRPVWANIAAGTDLLFALGLAVACAVLFTHPGEATIVPTADTAGYMSLAISIGLVAFGEFAHRQATRPARPKRVTSPVVGESA